MAISNFNGLALEQGLGAIDFRIAQSTSLSSDLFAARSAANVFVAGGQNFLSPASAFDFSSQMLTAYQGLGHQWSALLAPTQPQLNPGHFGIGLGSIASGVSGFSGPTHPVPLPSVHPGQFGVGFGSISSGVSGFSGPTHPVPLPHVRPQQFGVGLGSISGGVSGFSGPTFAVPLPQVSPFQFGVGFGSISPGVSGFSGPTFPAPLPSVSAFQFGVGFGSVLPGVGGFFPFYFG